MRVRLCATIRKPAPSIIALIAPVKLRAVASGLMIEKVRSIAIGLFFKEENAGEQTAAAYSERSLARQDARRISCSRAAVRHKPNSAERRLPAPAGRKTSASRKLVRGPSLAPRILALVFYRGTIEPGGSLARLTGRMWRAHPTKNQERPMIRRTIFAIATVAAIGAAALIPTAASAGGGKGGGMGHHGGHGYWGGGFGGIVVIGPSCWRWVPGLGRVYVCY